MNRSLLALLAVGAVTTASPMAAAKAFKLCAALDVALSRSNSARRCSTSAWATSAGMVSPAARRAEASVTLFVALCTSSSRVWMTRCQKTAVAKALCTRI